jgi:hypothetical protein
MGRTKELFYQLQEEFVAKCQAVEDGDISILDALIEFRRQKKECEDYIEIIKSFESSQSEQIEIQIEKNEGHYKGAELAVRQGGRMYNYSKISEWQIASNNLKCVEEKYKNAFINKEKGLTTVDEDGVILEEFPDVTYRKNSIIVKLKD